MQTACPVASPVLPPVLTPLLDTLPLQATAQPPSALLLLVQSANDLRNSGQLQLARQRFQQALTAEPSCWQAHLGLSSVYAQLHDSPAAARHRRAAFQGRSVIPLPYRGAQPPITILELVAIGPGNARINLFLSDTIYQRYLVAAEFADNTTPLPPHQLVLNAIGDPDSAPAALAGAQALLARTFAPVINQPSEVLATGRCAVADRLAHLPGVRTARTLTLPRQALLAPSAANSLAARGFTFPLLLRTPGFHGGQHFLRVESPADIPQAAATLPGSELIVLEFLEARLADSKIRKYRVMIIDGQLYPLHAAVSHHWKIHYFSAEMDDSPLHRAEDEAFLQDMPAVLGPRAMAALHGIQTELALDYGGIDFALDPHGDILLFEANATMAVFPPPDQPQWNYRRPAVANICAAVHSMLRRRALPASA